MKNLYVLTAIVLSTITAVFQIYVLSWWIFPAMLGMIITAWVLKDWFVYQTHKGQYIAIAWYLAFAVPVAGLGIAFLAAGLGLANHYVFRFLYRKAGLEYMLTY